MFGRPLRAGQRNALFPGRRVFASGGEDLGATSGLLFPENGAAPSSTNVAFYFDAPQNDGLPIWGPSNAGVTVIWKYRPSQQTGYYTSFFWGRGDGTFLAGEGYWGAHPYPPGGASDTTHNWEISISGGDEQTTRASTTKTVVKDGTWYTQALRIQYNNANSKQLIFYTSLPSTANADVIDFTEGYTNYGISPATTSPIFIWGDARWSPGGERANGVIRHIKIFDTLLSESDTLAEAASESMATSNGAAHIWYRKINPTPDDLLCDSGTGRNPAWRNASYKAALWTP